MDYATLYGVVRRFWFVILALMLLGLLVSLTYTKFTPAEYTAQADVVVVVDGDVDLSSGSTFALQQARNLSVIANRQRVVDPVIERLDLPETAMDLRKVISATVPANTSIVTLEVTYDSAERATSIVNALADSLSKSAEDIFPSVTTSGAQVVLRPIYQLNPPQNPSSPGALTIAAVGLVGGLASGLAAALLLNYTKPKGASLGKPAAPTPVWDLT